jgi:N utilization substance protein B
MDVEKRARHRGRVLAVQALYQVDLAGVTPEQALATSARLGAWRDDDDGGTPPDADSTEMRYARDLVSSVGAARQRIDGLIEAACVNWRLERMSRLDVQVLRVGTAELLAARPDVPPAVAIDEAIEIARQFCGDEAPGFVNGVLDAVARELRATGKPGTPSVDEG